MINLDGKILRNLEEQVLDNQHQIEVLKQLGMPGVKISGIVDDISELPSPASDGDLYALRATLDEYDLYLYYDGAWENLGQFPKQGPQGLTGLTGATGPKGDSSTWYAGSSFPTSTLRAGDMFLNILTCQVYRYNGTQWISQTNIKGAAGNDGQNGNSILSIDAQHQNDKTKITMTTTHGGTTVFNIPDGKPGAGFHVAHIYPEDDADMPSTLPADIVDTLDELWPASEADPSEAILVKTSTQGDFIFVILTTNGVQAWDEAGQIESVQGPAGEPGDRIMDSSDIEKEAAVGYENTYKLKIKALPYLTVAPTANFSGPGLKIVVLDAEPATYYDGYLYIIKE